MNLAQMTVLGAPDRWDYGAFTFPSFRCFLMYIVKATHSQGRIKKVNI